MIKLSVVCCVIFLGGVVVADNVPALIWGAFNQLVYFDKNSDFSVNEIFLF